MKLSQNKRIKHIQSKTDGMEEEKEQTKLSFHDHICNISLLSICFVIPGVITAFIWVLFSNSFQNITGNSAWIALAMLSLIGSIVILFSFQKLPKKGNIAMSGTVFLKSFASVFISLFFLHIIFSNYVLDKIPSEGYFNIVLLFHWIFGILAFFGIILINYLIIEHFGEKQNDVRHPLVPDKAYDVSLFLFSLVTIFLIVAPPFIVAFLALDIQANTHNQTALVATVYILLFPIIAYACARLILHIYITLNTYKTYRLDWQSVGAFVILLTVGLAILIASLWIGFSTMADMVKGSTGGYITQEEKSLRPFLAFPFFTLMFGALVLFSFISVTILNSFAEEAPISLLTDSEKSQ